MENNIYSGQTLTSIDRLQILLVIILTHEDQIERISLQSAV